ncbi:MAG: hypothetical protein Kow0099_22120 [Candidatus Abyssubacteria bacterium]
MKSTGSTDNGARIPTCHFLGLGLISLSILMLELSLTRIFSVTMWYHFAFVAISVALFGISLSGLVVFLFERAFPKEKLAGHLSLFSGLMAVSIVVALFVVLRTPFNPRLTVDGVLTSGLIYGAVTVPFFLGGVCISLLLWRHADRVGSLYFSDLLGASVGCLATLVALNTFTGPQVVLLAAVISAGAGVFFSIPRADRRMTIAASALFALAMLVFLFNRSVVLTELLAVKNPSKAGQVRSRYPLFEDWNSFSRVTVMPLANQPAFGWGLSLNFRGYHPPQLGMVIDAAAGMQLIGFDGDLRKARFLKYDLTFLVHWLKDDAKVLIIGPGGGRDVLAALVFEQNKVTGVEVNPIIVRVVRDEFADFVGHLYQRPDVKIHVDEGRSFISRSDEEFDIIQASFIDTWASTSSGAFALTENNLYTLEAFREYLSRLRPDGMLSFSRWHHEAAPGETLRLAALAIESLESIGVDDPARHVFIARKGFWLGDGPDGIATIIVKKSPFTEPEIKRAHEVCERMGFEVVSSPGSIESPLFRRLFDKQQRERLYQEYPLVVEPPTDDKPFFFHMARVEDVLWKRLEQGRTQYNVKAVEVLVNVFVAILTLAVLFLILPLFLFRSEKPRELIKRWRYLMFFILIGLGFMMTEIPLIQRFTLFLGHPIYALSVILFSLLLFSSIGSLTTRRITRPRSFLIKGLVVLVVLLIAYVHILPPVIHTLIDLPTIAKIPLTVLLIAPLGLLMGMPFPLGIKLTSKNAEFLIPWCWSLNGAFSVFGSVASMMVSVSHGFTVTMMFGWAAYCAVLALILFFRMAE